MKKAFTLGLFASFFFSFTFILNRQMNLQGGSWYWSSSLRYWFILILLFFYIMYRKRLANLIDVIKKNPGKWILWSTVGFGLFYAPLTFASEFGASWMIASTWQLTIIAGALLTPFFWEVNETGKIRKKLPIRPLLVSSIILVGVVMVQLDDFEHINIKTTSIILSSVLLAAFSYPLGNRKIMELNQNKLPTIERVFAMTLCSIPFWLVISSVGYFKVGMPANGQILQAFLVAVFAGIIATVLFFSATDKVSANTHNLAIIESTQSGSIVFTLLMSTWILGEPLPSLIGLIGIIIVIAGMILINFVHEKKTP